MATATVALSGCAEPVADAPVDATPTLAAYTAWARAADSGATTAVYFMLENRDSIADTVRGVSAEAAEEAGLHISTQHSGLMHMTPIVALPVPARDSVSFRPLGAHVMLTRLKRPLVDGDTVHVTLRFVSGDSLTVGAHVRKP